MTGVEPVSKRSPTFRPLQFSLMIDKTVTRSPDTPLLNLPVKLSGSPYRLQDHRIHFHYAAFIKWRRMKAGSLQSLRAQSGSESETVVSVCVFSV